MIYQNTFEFADGLDKQDELKHFRNGFLIPQHHGADAIYLCGNSLGLQPAATEKYIAAQLNSWKELAVEGWFQGDDPWLEFHHKLKQPLSRLTGAKTEEVTVMNSLTVNLHLLFVSFYQPTSKKYKILMEGGAFPSDQYAVESQVRFHGFEPEKAIIELFPRDGEFTLRTEDILSAIEKNADELALVLFGGVNYYTGQLFHMEAIVAAAHKAGAYAGFDLAHATGNVPLHLHNWSADFACWCSYKYINSGPGGISGIFVHEKHFNNPQLKRFAGWWGYRPDKRFLMAPGFDPAKGAEGWQVSTSPILLMATHKAALDIFEKAGGLDKLRPKSILLTGYLEFLVREINSKHGEELFKIITPKNPDERGCQLSIVCKRDGKATFNYLAQNGVIGDWREPDVIRLSPVPLYNSFKDVYDAARRFGQVFGHFRIIIMLKVAYDPIYAHPLPEGHRFPMLKYELIPAQLLREGIITKDSLFSPGPLDEEIILWTHDESYWHQLRDLTLPPKEQRRTGFPLSARLVEREIRIAKGTIDGCHFASVNGIAFNVAGGTHHAGTNWGEGFCLLNDQAIAANYLLNNNLYHSILIIDLDVHQGNGTAQIFENEPRVFTFSMHGANNFPYRKEKSDLDIPLPDGMMDEEYLNILKQALPGLIDNQKPDFIFYLAGVDILATDKLGKLSLSKEGCKERDRFVLEQCIKHHIPVQVSMGGGYSADIKDIIDAHCNTYRLALDLYF